MLRRSIKVLILTLLVQNCLAQLKSPEEFLGYPIGSRFTPHWKIVDYFRTVATAVPSIMKLEQYGQTNEGRPLMVAFISAASNISNLETIRQNNLRLANDARNASSGNAPAIVWLSYNVHGNEASSSEASMLTLYALVDPKNAQTKQWLQNTLVIIDPCLNPDGRDRYVNWFNSVVGRQYNPALDAREHNEPWPGGRSNHYNFDLNRDWAWQTQVETQQRVKLYNDWLPQIHVDFHEQGINNPYYFAPAAQPYHEVITPWQRTFQEVIGHNHAKYFDEKGWLYFTKEVFDLLYPSYGDTYPIYNGAIGMTYEQGGGPRGGLGALTEEGDTLTLADRAMHHFTTSLSTLETASQNASKLVSEFQNFYKNAVTAGVGNYKSYVIRRTPGDTGRLSALTQLLDRNKILYYAARNASGRGYNYDNGKEENFTVDTNDLVIPSLQPKSTLVKVLFEPNAILVDSATYDITAWSLPYVYGLKSYASKTNIPVGGAWTKSDVFFSPPQSNPYGYVIPWNDIRSAKLAGELMQKGIKLRYAEEPFQMGGQSFDRGSIIVLRTSNQSQPALWNTVRALAASNRVSVFPVSSGFAEKGYDFGSNRVHPMKARRVAVLTGEGVGSNAAGEVWHFFEQTLNYPVTLINANDVPRINLNDYDVVVMPDGNYRFLNDKTTVDVLRSWINSGGHIVAMEGAVSQLAKQEWAGLKPKKEEDTDNKDVYEALKKYESRERDMISNTTPGSIFRVELDNTHPLAFGYHHYYYTLKQDDNVYDFIKDGGWNVGVIKKDKQVAGFVGSKLQNRLQDGLLFGVQDMGRGSITYLADDVLFRNFWENGKLIFANAVFLVGQ
ncbi:MAG TPA: M14 family metallopeptidase [Flavisolibacter sp.]|nr:M14 family metallopeptidase [Flavisolibacter sp.]